MSFLNALAWFCIAWFALWSVASTYRLATERHMLTHRLIEYHVARRAPWMFGLFVVSVLWLIFG